MGAIELCALRLLSERLLGDVSFASAEEVIISTRMYALLKL